MPAAKVVPEGGVRRHTTGVPSNPAGWFWIPAKIMHSTTAINIVTAEIVARTVIPAKVLGMEKIKQIMVVTTPNTTEHAPWLEMELRYLLPTKTWRPWMKVLFRRNMMPVTHQAHFLPQNRCCPISQTSRTLGFLRQNSQRTSPVYRVERATAAVRISPGTRPRTEYDHGKLRMAKQMYSLNSRAAVFCQEQVRYLMSCSASSCATSSKYFSREGALDSSSVLFE